MAFFGRLGSLMRQTISQNGMNGQIPMASMLNNIRCMSSSKLFIGGLSYGTDENSLKDAFSGFGDVVEAKVITDRDTGKSRGFGFVSFDTEESAGSALSAMDGQPLDGRNVRVSYATERQSAPRSYGGGSGGGYGGGGYGGSGGGGGAYRGGFGDSRENDSF